MAFQLPVTANADEDVLLEYCKQLTWEYSLVKGSKKQNRSWPQVMLFNNLVPCLLQSPASVRDTYFTSLTNYGDFIKFFRAHAPGRNGEHWDNWQSFESWGYELVPSQEAYSQDERFRRGIFPKIYRSGPFGYLLVMYPPYFAAAFEFVDQEALKKKQLEDSLKAQRQSNLSSLYANSGLSAPANTATTTSNNSKRNTITGSATASTSSSTKLVTSVTNDSYTIPRSNLTEEEYKKQQSKQQSEAFCKRKDMYTSGTWLTTASARHDKLCMEIEDLFRRSVPPRYVTDRRKRLVDKIVNMLRRQYPGIKLRVEMFGSSATGLDFADSDIDLCILVPEQYYLSDIFDMYKKQRERNSYYNMWMLAGLLKRVGMVNIAAIPRANVPICKFEDPFLQLKADINTQNDMGLENSKLIKEYTFLEPRVRPFLYAIKTFTKMRRINDSSTGTLSSYTYVLMGLFFLMTCSPPVIPNLQCLDGGNECESVTCRSRIIAPKLSTYRGKPKQFDVSFHNCVTVIGVDDRVPAQHQQDLLGGAHTFWRCHNTQTIGDLLIGFFTFYSMLYNYERALSIRSGTTIRKLPAWRKQGELAVEDPFITDRNVAVSCSKEGFELVLREFERAAKLLKGNMDLATVFELVPEPTIYDDVLVADPYQYGAQQQQQYHNRQQQRQQQQSAHTMRLRQLAAAKHTYGSIERSYNPRSDSASSSSNSNKETPSTLTSAPAATTSQGKMNDHAGVSTSQERTHSSNDSPPTVIPKYSPISATGEAEVNKKQQKHAIELDARDTEQATPPDELSDMESVQFTPSPQKKSLPTTKPTTSSQSSENRNNGKQKMHERVIPTHNIEPQLQERVVPSQKNDVKLNNNKHSVPANTIGYMEVADAIAPDTAQSVDDDDDDNYLTPPSTIFAESPKGNSTSTKPRASEKEDRLVGTLPTDDEEKGDEDDQYYDDVDDEDDGEEETHQPFTPKDIDDNNNPIITTTAAAAITADVTKATTAVDRKPAALPLPSSVNPAAVVVKKATMKLLDTPHYVDKLDIVDALEAFGFEVITVRSELVGQDELDLFPVKEWLVRVIGGLNQDLPACFGLQDMAFVRSYETRRLVAYRSVNINNALSL